MFRISGVTDHLKGRRSSLLISKRAGRFPGCSVVRAQASVAAPVREWPAGTAVLSPADRMAAAEHTGRIAAGHTVAWTAAVSSLDTAAAPSARPAVLGPH